MRKIPGKKACMLMKHRARLKKSIAAMETLEKELGSASPLLALARKELEKVEKILEGYGDLI